MELSPRPTFQGDINPYCPSITGKEDLILDVYELLRKHFKYAYEIKGFLKYMLEEVDNTLEETLLNPPTADEQRIAELESFCEKQRKEHAKQIKEKEEKIWELERRLAKEQEKADLSLWERITTAAKRLLP